MRKIKKRIKLIVLTALVMMCSLFVGFGFTIGETKMASAAGVDYTTKTFSSCPKGIELEDEKYVYKVSCFSPRGYVDDEEYENYVTSISFRASMGCQIYFADGVACRKEDASYEDNPWDEYANYYDILYYDATNHYVYIRFKNLAYLTDDPNVSADLADLCFQYKKLTYNPAPQRIHYDIFEPIGYFYNTSGAKISSYYYNNAFYYKAVDEGEGISYTQYKKPGSTTWTTYTNGSTIAKGATNGLYYFRAVDKLGNVSSEVSIFLDSTAPTGKVYAGGLLVPNNESTAAASLYYNATDANGIAVCYVKSPGASGYVGYVNGSLLTESGEYSFYCIDRAGNSSSVYTVLMDHDPPILSCGETDFGSSIGNSFCVEASDALGDCTLYYKTATGKNYIASSSNSVYIPVTLSDGKYYFYAVDEYGNTSDVYWIELKVPLPTVSIVHVNGSNSVYATWTSSRIESTVNGSKYTKGALIATEGAYTLVVKDTMTTRTNTYTFTIGHYYEVIYSVSPTCTEQGYSVYECISCGNYYYDDYVAAKGHSYSKTIHEATCTEQGYTINVCRSCQDTYRSEYVVPLGHNYLATYFEANCTEKGGIHYECSRCLDTYDVYTINAQGHHYYEERIEPTCETGGYIIHICTECDYRYKSDEQSPLGHSRITWVSIVATCIKEGKRIHQCEICGNVYTTIIPCLEHKYVVTDTETNGSVTRHYDCSECGHSYSEDRGNQYEVVTSYIEYLYEEYSPYMIWVFLSTAGVWSIVMGVALIIAYRNEDKIKAKQMVKNYVIGLVLIFGILVAMPYLVNGIAYLITH